MPDQDEGARPAISRDDFEEIMRTKLGIAEIFGFRVASLFRGRARLSMPFQPALARPGGIISGPALFGLADAALYGAVLSIIGQQEMSVTTGMTINFLRPARPGTVLADARIIKAGRTLAYGEINITVEPSHDIVAHATGTYIIPG
jgi:uncharacterized protein (TIGR00369 family)